MSPLTISLPSIIFILDTHMLQVERARKVNHHSPSFLDLSGFHGDGLRCPGIGRFDSILLRVRHRVASFVACLQGQCRKEVTRLAEDGGGIWLQVDSEPPPFTARKALTHQTAPINLQPPESWDRAQSKKDEARIRQLNKRHVLRSHLHCLLQMFNLIGRVCRSFD